MPIRRIFTSPTMTSHAHTHSQTHISCVVSSRTLRPLRMLVLCDLCTPFSYLLPPARADKTSHNFALRGGDARRRAYVLFSPVHPLRSIASRRCHRRRRRLSVFVFLLMHKTTIPTLEHWLSFSTPKITMLSTHRICIVFTLLVASRTLALAPEPGKHQSFTENP